MPRQGIVSETTSIRNGKLIVTTVRESGVEITRTFPEALGRQRLQRRIDEEEAKRLAAQQRQSDDAVEEATAQAERDRLQAELDSLG